MAIKTLVFRDELDSFMSELSKLSKIIDLLEENATTNIEKEYTEKIASCINNTASYCLELYCELH